MTEKQRDAIVRHGENLLAIFPQATERDPVKLCKKLRRLERLAHDGATAYCNGEGFDIIGHARFEFNSDEAAWERFSSVILASMNKVLAFTASKVPVFVNGDARGYALKIDDAWMQKTGWTLNKGNRHTNGSGSIAVARLHKDLGGYGIIAPEIDAAGH